MLTHSFLRVALGLSAVVLLSQCAGNTSSRRSGSNTESSADANAVLTVPVSFGLSALGLTDDSFKVESLTIETIPVCGGESFTFEVKENPAMGIPVCKANSANRPLLRSVRFTIKSDGNEREYSLDLANHGQMPKEISISEKRTPNGVEYTIEDRGTGVTGAIDIVTKFINKGLAVQYLDMRFVKSLSFKLISDAVLRIAFDDCKTCQFKPDPDRKMPDGIAVVSDKDALGYFDLDTSRAAAGKYVVPFIVLNTATKETAAGSTVISIKREELPPDRTLLAVAFLHIAPVFSGSDCRFDVPTIPVAPDGIQLDAVAYYSDCTSEKVTANTLTKFEVVNDKGEVAPSPYAAFDDPAKPGFLHFTNKTPDQQTVYVRATFDKTKTPDLKIAVPPASTPNSSLQVAFVTSKTVRSDFSRTDGSIDAVCQKTADQSVFIQDSYKGRKWQAYVGTGEPGKVVPAFDRVTLDRVLYSVAQQRPLIQNTAELRDRPFVLNQPFTSGDLLTEQGRPAKDLLGGSPITLWHGPSIVDPQGTGSCRDWTLSVPNLMTSSLTLGLGAGKTIPEPCLVQNRLLCVSDFAKPTGGNGGAAPSLKIQKIQYCDATMDGSPRIDLKTLKDKITAIDQKQGDSIKLSGSGRPPGPMICSSSFDGKSWTLRIAEMPLSMPIGTGANDVTLSFSSDAHAPLVSTAVMTEGDLQAAFHIVDYQSITVMEDANKSPYSNETPHLFLNGGIAGRTANLTGSPDLHNPYLLLSTQYFSITNFPDIEAKRAKVVSDIQMRFDTILKPAMLANPQPDFYDSTTCRRSIVSAKSGGAVAEIVLDTRYGQLLFTTTNLPGCAILRDKDAIRSMIASANNPDAYAVSQLIRDANGK